MFTCIVERVDVEMTFRVAVDAVRSVLVEYQLHAGIVALASGEVHECVAMPVHHRRIVGAALEQCAENVTLVSYQ